MQEIRYQVHTNVQRKRRVVHHVRIILNGKTAIESAIYVRAQLALAQLKSMESIAVDMVFVKQPVQIKYVLMQSANVIVVGEVINAK